MKEEWDDKERDPIRGVQIFDAEAQKQFDHMSMKDRLQWLQAINELYWKARIGRETEKAAEPRKPYQDKK